MPCIETPRLEAWFDGEGDDTSVVAGLDQHLAQCDECRATLAAMRDLRQTLREVLPGETAPLELRTRILGALAEACASPEPQGSAGWSTHRSWRLPAYWLGVGSGVGVAGLAALLILLSVTALRSKPLLDELAAAHVRSLQPSRLMAVVSTDRHTVKPWFAGRADVSPAVADFAGAGYRLLGGRVDDIRGQRAAVVVYQYGAHIINVFSWSDGTLPLPGEASRRGYRIACWTVADVGYCAVTDADFAGLHGLEQLLRGLGP